MPKRLLSLSLLLLSVAMLLLVAGFALAMLGLSLLTGLLYAVAAKILLLGFALLALQGVITLITTIVQHMIGYFDRDAAIQRRFWALHQRRQQIQQRLIAQTRQLYYRHQFKRERLSLRDDRKRSRELWRSIRNELIAMKSQLPATQYKAFSRALKTERKHANIDGLLALREQLTRMS